MTQGSQQLRMFRIALRDGATVENAAELAGISLKTAAPAYLQPWFPEAVPQ